MHQTLNQQLHGVSLRDVLPDGRAFGAADIRTTSCCSDSRRCRQGDLFVALVGAEEDGHEYARDAVRRGARAVLGERHVPVDVPTYLVNDTRYAYARVCQALAGNPSQHMHVIGVTGTSGKTTTSMLITAVLEAGGYRSGIMGSLGYSDSIDSAAASSATPSPPELADWLARMRANGCSHAVLELSSIALARHQAAGVELSAGCLTNVRRDHLDYHGSLLNYRDAKGRMFQHLKQDGFAVINADDAASNRYLASLECPALAIGMRHPVDAAGLTATVVERHKSEQTFLMSAGSETVPVRTRMIGDHHVYNCLTAAAIGLVNGMDLAAIARGLEAIDSLPGRMERIECGQPFGVFVDNAHNADSLAVVLKTLRAVTKGKLYCVFGAAGDECKDKRPLMGRVAERGCDVAVLTTNDPGTEPPLSIIHDILDGYDRPSRAQVMPDRARAICWAIAQAKKGDTVLIAGLGEQPYPVAADQGNCYADRDIARGLLYEIAEGET